jgi:hypothetical protein
VQLVLQALAEQMSSFGQTCAAGATQAPALQLLCPTRLVPEQVAPAQEVVGKTHAPAEPHEPAQVPEPPQAGWLLCGVELAARFVHVPCNPGRSQATHDPVQAVLQQYPSGEQVLPETHPAATVLQVCPSLLLQAPLASQVPAQRPFGSASFVAATQVWVLALQAMQVPVQLPLVQHPPDGIQVVAPPAVHDFIFAGQL